MMKTSPQCLTASIPAATDPVARPTTPGWSGFVRRGWARLRRWRLYRRDKQILLALSDDQLRDIGLTRGDIHHYNEALHQHWRARRR
ncbi:DUF1127 domain-containing protein [Sodalis praecaptivus]|uniref:DUF1127 domain-containing protein n=1 Tax=Sodalis TaxID=84565 RepID=UPI0009E05455|nr:DUF1127 domain-containing protein [Sodalis praecaptivus]